MSWPPVKNQYSDNVLNIYPTCFKETINQKPVQTQPTSQPLKIDLQALIHNAGSTIYHREMIIKFHNSNLNVIQCEKQQNMTCREALKEPSAGGYINALGKR
ncbi:hypothetical protein Peur_072831 [Populus x canadensis]